MNVTRHHITWIFFLSSLMLSNSKRISFYVEQIKRILSKNAEFDGICLTPECVRTAARVISSLDESVDPCENLYRFACGGWMSSHEIEDGISVSEDEILQDDIEMKLKGLLEKELDGTEPAFVKMLKDMYHTCIDWETLDELGSEPLRKDLLRLGGWPVVQGSEWNETLFDWVDTTIAFRRSGHDFDMLVNITVEVDERNKTTHIITLDRSKLSYEPFLLIYNGITVEEHYKKGVKDAVHLGADVKTAEKELLEALQFETEIAKLLRLPQEEKNDVSSMDKRHTAAEYKEMRNVKRRVRRDANGMYSRYTVAELQNMIPEIPWLKLFNGLLDDEIGETENIAVTDPIFYKRLARLLERTEKRVVANYMFWRIVEATRYELLLSRKWRDSEYTTIDKYRKRLCYVEVPGFLRIALSSYYVREYFKQEKKYSAMELVKYIHREFLRILEDADWMDDVTKKEAIEKANNIKLYIGYPEEFFNDTAIMEFYKNLTISNSSYYENVMNARKWKVDHKFSVLRKPYIKGRQWSLEDDDVTTRVNAYYTFESNSIEVPAAQLQREYFETYNPQYMNFGAVGAVVGHEITHGFDVSGKQYDKDGNKVDWWDKTTDEMFQERVQCIIEQYSNYTAENGMKLNGEKTKDDDIADNGGLKVTYRAYHSWVENNGLDLLLPGIKYNQDQLFWISYAQRYCMKSKPDSIRFTILYDHHSVHEYRVIGPASNLPEFSKDFNCPSDSPMNRENKCHVW